MLGRSGNNHAKKSVSYNPLSTTFKRRDSDEIDIEETLIKEDKASVYTGQRDATGNDTGTKAGHHLSFHEEQNLLGHERRSNKYGGHHRRAESLGNVGQTRRNWSPPSPNTDDHAANDGGKAFPQGSYSIIL